MAEDADSESHPSSHLMSAARSFSDGDVHATADHLANALCENPRDGDAFAFLEAFASIFSDPLRWCAPHPIQVRRADAVHSLLLARRERQAEAIIVLVRLLADDPHLPFATWIEGWSRYPEVLADVQIGPLEVELDELLATHVRAPHSPALRASLSQVRDFLRRLALSRRAPAVYDLLSACERALGDGSSPFGSAVEVDQLGEPFG